jgi:hypothetical protein
LPEPADKELLKSKKRALVSYQILMFLPKWQSCAGHPAKPIVAFRAIGERFRSSIMSSAHCSRAPAPLGRRFS